MPKYTVETKFIFSGEFIVEAESAKQAEEYVVEHCGLVIGGDIHSSLPEEDVNWDFIVHPDKEIGLIKVNR